MWRAVWFFVSSEPEAIWSTTKGFQGGECRVEISFEVEDFPEGPSWRAVLKGRLQGPLDRRAAYPCRSAERLLCRDGARREPINDPSRSMHGTDVISVECVGSSDPRDLYRGGGEDGWTRSGPLAAFPLLLFFFLPCPFASGISLSIYISFSVAIQVLPK